MSSTSKWNGLRPVDFIGSISSDHMQNRLFSAGMSREPFIQLEDSLVGNDDLMALGDELMDVLARERPELGDGICVALPVGNVPCRHDLDASVARGWLS